MDAEDFTLGDYYSFYLRSGIVLQGVVVERDWARAQVRIQQGCVEPNDRTPVTTIRIMGVDAVVEL